MGRGGGPSLRERSLQHQIHAHRLDTQRKFRNPFDCPRCSKITFNVKKVKAPYPQGRHWEGFCGRCKLSIVLQKYASTLEKGGIIDAYNFLCDQYRQEQKLKTSTTWLEQAKASGTPQTEALAREELRREGQIP